MMGTGMSCASLERSQGSYPRLKLIRPETPPLEMPKRLLTSMPPILKTPRINRSCTMTLSLLRLRLLKSEQVRILRYSAPGGHGYTAEDANNINDILRGMSSEIIGTSNELNGPDRVSNAVFLQSKYYQSASETVAAAFSYPDHPKIL